MKTFRLPDVGEGLHEAELVEWRVEVGQAVAAGQPLALVETDKAVVEVASPRAGRIARRHGAPGDRIAVGEPLVEFQDGGHEDGEREDAGTVVGEIPRAAGVAPPPGALAEAAGAGGVRAAPAVRALARELGVDLARVAGGGPGGAPTRADVERAAAEAGERGAAAGDFEPLRGVRLAMARHMERARAEVVPATVVDEADVQAWFTREADVMLRLVRAVVAGCKAAPALHGWYDGRARARRLHARVDLGVAVQTDDGLFVPVLRDAGGRAPAELRRDLDALVAAVRARRVAPEALRGATFTLSNFGTLFGRFAALVVLPPQVAILGVGRAEQRVVVREGAPAVRWQVPLSLSFDHRAATGAEAAAFLAAAVADLERPG
jgi:pyruvate dehydrogenase E2 component (dihydrolipoamide acetyltransferase)